jgi:hypothetical protein
MPGRNPIQHVRDHVCLAAHEDGRSTEELALIVGVSTRTIRRWIARAKDNPKPGSLRLELLMAPGGLMCEHGVQVQADGLPWLCLDCDQTGMPHHPAFRRTKYSEPATKPAKSKLAGESANVVFVRQTEPSTPAKPKKKRS